MSYLKSQSTSSEDEVIQEACIFGLPINPFPGPCPIIRHKSFKPIKVHFITLQLRLVIPVSDPVSSVHWLRQEFGIRAKKRGFSIEPKHVYFNDKILEDNLRLVNILKDGDAVKNFNENVKRKYKKGGHKKLARVASLLNSFLGEMMIIDSDKARQEFYTKVSSLPEIQKEDLGKEEIVNWFKRAKRKQFLLDNGSPRVKFCDTADANKVEVLNENQTEQPLRKKIKFDLNSENPVSSTWLSTNSTNNRSSSRPYQDQPLASVTGPLRLRPVLSPSNRSSPLSWLDSEDISMEWRDLILQGAPLSPSVLSIPSPK